VPASWQLTHRGGFEIKGLVGLIAVIAALAMGAGTALAKVPASGATQATSSCSAHVKHQRAKRLAAFERRMAARRKAYFKNHKNAKQRRAFVKGQLAMLRALKRAVRSCRVAPAPPHLPPPSTGPPCSPSLDPGPQPKFENEGVTDYSVHLHSNGELHGVMIFVDFPDAPANESTQGLYDLMVPPASTWYKAESYGRIGLDITPVNVWVRMPHPSTWYMPDPFLYDPRYLQDAVAAADYLVDYSQYNVVYIIASGNSAIHRGQTPVGPPGSGVPTNDGVEVRRAVYLGADARLPTAVAHETGHLFGLPDLYQESDTSRYDLVGSWDPMSNPFLGEGFFAWHRWKLGFLDPAQLRCLTAPTILEETLAPLEMPGGVKSVVIPVSASKAYVVEVRQQIGHDAALCDHGVLLYTVDATVASLQGPVQLIGARRATGRCGPLDDGAFDVGPYEVPKYEDSSIRLEVLATDGSSYRVRVTKK
jgi:M6 family metalloprotease-like protein